jgi:hypothetical protein
MNTTAPLDTVLELKDLPQSSIGAPSPALLADEHSLWLAYYVEEPLSSWDGRSVQVVSPTTSTERCALVEFVAPVAHKFGGPNDEAFTGHPLAAHGLEPYANFEVRASSWIAALEHMNSVHPRHIPGQYSEFKHLILAFHDSVFECVAKGYRSSVHVGSVRDVLLRQRHEA